MRYIFLFWMLRFLLDRESCDYFGNKPAWAVITAKKGVTPLNMSVTDLKSAVTHPEIPVTLILAKSTPD